MRTYPPRGMGWIPDLPDARDFGYRHPVVLPLLQRLKSTDADRSPDEVDLRKLDHGAFFPPPDDQQQVNCSPVFAVIRLLDYFHRRVTGHTFEASPLFLYRVARHQHSRGRPARGDTGTSLRDTLKTLTKIGVPPGEYWPYNIDQVDAEPGSFTYGVAEQIPGLHYFRLDERNTDGETTWRRLTSFLAAGFPVVFGFPVPSSLTRDSDIPFRPDLDSVCGGQSALAIGFTKHFYGRGNHALLIRNSWGGDWGDNGDGRLPYGYVRRQLARDFWTCIHEDWVSADELSLPGDVAAVGEA